MDFLLDNTKMRFNEGLIPLVMRKKSHAVLMGIILFFLVTNIVWFMEDHAPPMWDQAHYLERSEVLYNTLTKKGLVSLIPAFGRILETKAPLITVFPIPFYLLFDHPYVNGLTLNYLSANKGSMIHFFTNDLYLRENMDETVEAINRESDYVLTKSDKPGNESLLKSTPTMPLLNRNGLRFRQAGEIPLPDQTFLSIYKKNRRDSATIRPIDTQ